MPIPFVVLLAAAGFVVAAADAEPAAAFRFADVNDKSLGLWEGTQPVLVYNHGIIRHVDVGDASEHSCYVHPLHGLDGEVLTDDFPKDHIHHRGLYWAWPFVTIDDKTNDMGGEDGIALGSEMSGDVRHVYFTDNILRQGASAIRFKANLDRGGTVEHIRVRNFTVESFENLFWFQLDYPGLLGGGHPSTYRDIVFENFTVERAGTVFDADAPARPRCAMSPCATSRSNRRTAPSSSRTSRV